MKSIDNKKAPDFGRYGALMKSQYRKSNMTSLALSFNDVNFTPVQQDNQIWLKTSELAEALGYKDQSSVTRIYSRNEDEFTQAMSCSVKLTEQGQAREVRVFSLRGCHLIAMFARTAIAKQFRKWVLDILDKEVGAPVAKTHKSERTALHEAHALLVTKTKHLNSSDAWKLIHQRFNVDDIALIPYDAIPVAVEYVHHLIAMYSNASKQAGLFDKDTYELIRDLAEAILSQNGMMQDVWKALMLINKKDMMYYSNFVIKSNVLARKVGIVLDFRTKQGLPLVDSYCKTINFSGGVRMGVNPNWFNAPA